MAVQIIRSRRGGRVSPVAVLSKLGQTVYPSTSLMPTDQGFYVCRFVAESYREKLRRLVLMCGIEVALPPDNPFHVTVVASPKSFPTSEFSVDRQPLDVRAVAFDSWEGHDGKGYVVLRVESARLSERNAQMIAAGCVSNFAEYNPHITIQVGSMLDATHLRTANTRLRQCEALIPMGAELFNTFDN